MKITYFQLVIGTLASAALFFTAVMFVLYAPLGIQNPSIHPALSYNAAGLLIAIGIVTLIIYLKNPENGAVETLFYAICEVTVGVAICLMPDMLYPLAIPFSYVFCFIVALALIVRAIQAFLSKKVAKTVYIVQFLIGLSVASIGVGIAIFHDERLFILILHYLIAAGALGAGSTIGFVTLIAALKKFQIKNPLAAPAISEDVLEIINKE